MIPKFVNEVRLPSKSLNEIQIPPFLHESIQGIHAGSWRLFFDQISTNLQGRIRGVTHPDDFLRLQGSINFCDELQNFFEIIQNPKK